jgi:hypothetical protein
MQRDHMQNSLEKLGIPPNDFRVLKLLPLIYVAWADGTIEPEQQQRIHDFAMRNYDLSAAGVAILNRWLTRRPTHEYIEEGLHDIYLLAQAEDDIEVDFSELPGLLSYAEAVGRSTARALDRPELGEAARRPRRTSQAVGVSTRAPASIRSTPSSPRSAPTPAPYPARTFAESS